MAETIPSWLATMREISGTRETSGGADNPVILGWARYIGQRFPKMAGYCANYNHDSIAWCGLTAAYCMARNGIEPPFGAGDTGKFLWAASWSSWGVKLDKPKLGCVMIFTRTGGNHVAFFEREEDGFYIVRGGNQSDAVNEARMPKSRFTAAVWPAGTATTARPAPPPAKTGAAAGFTRISKAALDLIVEEEVTSRQTYETKYRRPEWPGGQSGITVGIGYDVGAGVSTRDQLQRDWAGQIPQPMIDALAECIGVTGDAARTLLPGVRSRVDVPWDKAMTVFEKVTLPRYYDLTARALPNFEKLPLDCKGVLVSLVYNRGASFSKDGDRYREMRAIKAHMASGELELIPGELRSMKRLWPGVGGLLRRRDREAALFAAGLKKPVVTPEAATTTAVIVIGTGVAGNEATKKESSGTSIAIIVAVTVVIALAAFFIVRAMRKKT